MDSTSTYYAVGLISLIVATLLFIMYINVINMDLAMDEKEEDKNNDSSVQYISMDRQRKNNRRGGDDERHAKEVADQTNTDNLLGKDGHGQQKDFSKKPNWHPYGEGDHPGGVKSAEGFLPAANDITVKHKLQTGSENIRNTL